MLHGEVNQERSDDAYEAERSVALEALLASAARRKVVVAGPGTGKTHTFKELLKQTEPPTLVLTFINNLVADLEKSLGSIAEVKTLHGYAKWLLHSTQIIPGVIYYPSLPSIIDSDLSWVGTGETALADVEEALRTIDESRHAFLFAERSADYYRAVGHDLSVYKVVKHFRDGTVDIPAYSQIVVDEFQDFNPLEVALITELLKKSPTLIVGDDDQALYWFKLASPEHLRELHRDDDWTDFDLPFCSRCPNVVVEATHRLIHKAQHHGLLQERVDKPFECFLPEKRGDSHAYPRIIHARCSVHMGTAPYMARYIEGFLNQLDELDVHDSIKDGNPTALVIGPAYMTRPIYEYLAERFPDIEMKTRDKQEIRILDGYELLLRDPRSRLGWRIIMMMDLPPEMKTTLERALEGGEELADLLPDDYRNPHLRVVALIRSLREGNSLATEEESLLVSKTGESIQSLRSIEEEEAAGPEASQEEEEAESDEIQPSIAVTGSLVAAKGLQAEHVFIVGLHTGELPRDESAPTEAEVCQLLVGLTRAKKSCHLLTANRLFGQLKTDSPFIGWLGDLVERRTINKAYFQ